MDIRANEKEIQELNKYIQDSQTKVADWENEFVKDFRHDMRQSFSGLHTITKKFEVFSNNICNTNPYDNDEEKERAAAEAAERRAQSIREANESKLGLRRYNPPDRSL